MNAQVKRLALRVRAPAERAIRAGHPWVFDQSLIDPPLGQLGDLGVVFDRRGRFIALGLWDPTSPIRLRVLTQERVVIGPDWFQERLIQAQELRQIVSNSNTTGYRLIHGENDHLPGLIIDRYGSSLVLKLYTGAWVPHLTEIIKSIQICFSPERLILRLSRNIQALGQTFNLRDGQVLIGDLPPGPVLFYENGLVFEADIIQGQKTGFFLDQRENRARIGALARGKRVLNCFSFSGGFSVYCAQGGCRAVTSLDLSEHALASAQDNFAHNGLTTPHDLLKGDAFVLLGTLARQGQCFDLVILDPPSLAPRARDHDAALSGYSRLIRLGLGVLAPGGILVTCSCSAHVSRSDFLAVITETLRPYDYEQIAYTGHAPDHPVTFAESDYLKCWIGTVRD